MRPAKLTPQEVAASFSNLKDVWVLAKDSNALSAAFRFKDFAAAWAFMCRIASIAEAMDHHPEWTNVYNRVNIRLQTHDAGGLTALDFTLAEKIDQVAFDNPLVL